jgi:hypothetical protein
MAAGDGFGWFWLSWVAGRSVRMHDDGAFIANSLALQQTTGNIIADIFCSPVLKQIHYAFFMSVCCTFVLAPSILCFLVESSRLHKYNAIFKYMTLSVLCQGAKSIIVTLMCFPQSR